MNAVTAPRVFSTDSRMSGHFAPGNALSKSFKPFLACSLLLLAALGAVFLAGGPVQGGMGIFLAVAGMVLLLISPTRAVPWGFWGLSALILLAASSSMIPAEWIGLPSWRMKLQELPALLLPHQVTLDPRATLFWILVLSASILIALFLLGSPLSARGMERVALLVVLGCSAYAVVAWMSWQTEWRYPFFTQESWMQPSYGFFPNRNQTAGFLLTGALVSLGLIYRGITGGRLLPALIASASFALLVSMLLLFSKSRGGVVFLVIGVLLWIAGLGRQRSRWLGVGAAVLTLVISILFLTSGSELLVRLRGGSPDATTMAVVGTDSTKVGNHPGDSNPFADARVSIWRDTFSMIAGFPETGTGLGSYHLIYPFYAQKSLRDKTTARHAESDWFTLCTEAGIPTLLLVLGGVVLLACRIPGLALDSGKDWPVRWAFLAAFFAELLHGLVDVPLHKPELGWWIMLLGGIGFASGFGDGGGRGIALKCQRAFFFLGGIGMIVMGVILVKAQWWGGEALPPYAPASEEKKVMELFGDGEKPNLERAIAECRKAIEQYPLAPSLYYQLGSLLLDLGEDPKQSMALFAVENALAPHDPVILFEQGKLLLPMDPDATALLWQDALRRQLFLDHLPSSPIARSSELFQQILSLAAQSPPLLARIPEFSGLDPKLQLVWLYHPASDPSLIAAVVQDSPFMEKLAPREQGRLIQRWYERGEKAEVRGFLYSHPQYSRIAVSTSSAILASAGNYKEACLFLSEVFALPDMKSDASATYAIRTPGGDVPMDPFGAARYYFKLGNYVAARRLLDEALRNGQGEQGEVLLLRGRLNVRAGDWKSALSDLLGYLHATGQL